MVNRRSKSLVVIVGGENLPELEGLLEQSDETRLHVVKESSLTNIVSMCHGSGAYEPGLIVIDMRGNWTERFGEKYLNSQFAESFRRRGESDGEFRRRMAKQKGKLAQAYVRSIIQHTRNTSLAQVVALMDNGLNWNKMGFHGAISETKGLLPGVIEWEKRYREYVQDLAPEEMYATRKFSLGIIGTGSLGGGVAFESLGGLENLTQIILFNRTTAKAEAVRKQLLYSELHSLPNLEERIVVTKRIEDVLEADAVVVAVKEGYNLRRVHPFKIRETVLGLDAGALLSVAKALSDYRGLIVIGTNSLEGSAYIIEKYNHDPEVWRRIASCYPEPKRRATALLAQARKILSGSKKWQPFPNHDWIELIGNFVVGPHSKQAVPLDSQLIIRLLKANGASEYLRPRIKPRSKLEKELRRRIPIVNREMFGEGFKSTLPTGGFNHEAGTNVTELLRILFNNAINDKDRITCCTVRYPVPLNRPGGGLQYIYGAYPAQWTLDEDRIPRISKVFTLNEIPRLIPQGFKPYPITPRERHKIIKSQRATQRHYLWCDKITSVRETFSQLQMPILRYLFGEEFVEAQRRLGRSEYNYWETLFYLLEGPVTISPKERSFNPEVIGRVEPGIIEIARDTHFVSRMPGYHKRGLVSEDNIALYRQLYFTNLATRFLVSESETHRLAAIVQINWLLYPEATRTLRFSKIYSFTEGFDERVQRLNSKAETYMRSERFTGETLIKRYGQPSPETKRLVTKLKALGLPEIVD